MRRELPFSSRRISSNECGAGLKGLIGKNPGLQGLFSLSVWQPSWEQSPSTEPDFGGLASVVDPAAAL